MLNLSKWCLKRNKKRHVLGASYSTVLYLGSNINIHVGQQEPPFCIRLLASLSLKQAFLSVFLSLLPSSPSHLPPLLTSPLPFCPLPLFPLPFVPLSLPHSNSPLFSSPLSPSLSPIPSPFPFPLFPSLCSIVHRSVISCELLYVFNILLSCQSWLFCSSRPVLAI